MFHIEWEERSLGELNKLEDFVARKMLKRIEMLRNSNFLSNVKRLKNSKFFSLRTGDYRIIFDFDQKSKTIRILKVGHRKNIY
jgi:mRNA interferase RelE/StbE